MKTSRILVLLLSLAMVLVLVAACGQEAESPTSGPAAGQSGTAGSQPAAVELPKVVNIGTNQVGSTYHSVGSVLATVMTKYSPIPAKVVPLTGSLEWIPMMLTKEIDLGIVGDYEAWAALHGKEDFEKLGQGKGFPLRLVAAGHHNQTTMLTSEASGIKTGADLKGKRVTLTYSAGGLILKKQPYAFLANLGLQPGDVKDVPMSAMAEGVKAVIEGRADVAMDVSLTAPAVQELEAAKGARFISLDPSSEAIARAAEIIPGFQVKKVDPAPGRAGVKEPTYFADYPVYLVSRADLPDQAVGELLKALWDHNDEIVSAAKPLNEWTKAAFVTSNPIIPYHPGAVKFYKEIGAWPSDLDAKQDQLLQEAK